MQQQMQMTVPFTKMVKALVIANVAIWVGLVLILQNQILGNQIIFDLLGLVPSKVIHDFWLWQPVTYMFVHANGVFHVLFNMLVLWWFGAELESRWGSRFFLTYYMVCGIGAGLIYLAGILIYGIFSHNTVAMGSQLVGASGATYGLLLAYGILFGERLTYFMMLFPMKAKYFVLIIGLVELVTLLDSGVGSSVANLAHLGGIVVGFLFLVGAARIRRNQASTKPTKSKNGRKLRLVVNNDRKPASGSDDGPKYWN